MYIASGCGLSIEGQTVRGARQNKTIRWQLEVNSGENKSLHEFNSQQSRSKTQRRNTSEASSLFALLGRSLFVHGL
jgi:hypothetical protein